MKWCRFVNYCVMFLSLCWEMKPSNISQDTIINTNPADSFDISHLYCSYWCFLLLSVLISVHVTGKDLHKDLSMLLFRQTKHKCG